MRLAGPLGLVLVMTHIAFSQVMTRPAASAAASKSDLSISCNSWRPIHKAASNTQGVIKSKSTPI